MKRMKKLAAILALGTLALSVSGCGTIAGEVVDAVVEKAMGGATTTLVQGNLDAVYKGIISEEYLELLDGQTEEDLKQIYTESMEGEAEFFAYYFGMYDPEYGEAYEDLSEEIRTDILKLCKEIYGQTKYEVLESTALSEGSYSVKVSIEPSYIMKQAEEMYDRYDDLEAFWEKYKFTNVDNMSDSEYEAYANEYAQIIVQMVNELLPEMKYQQAKTQMVQLDKNENGLLVINEDDWNRINETLVYYP